MSSPDAPLGAQDTAMRLAIANAMMNWAEIENSLAILLEAALGQTPMSYGLILYYTPANTETRFNMVDAVVSKLLPTIWSGDHLTRCWSKYVQKLHKARKSRNKLAHGNVRTYCINQNVDDPRVRLVPPVLDASKWFQDHKPRQFPGLSVHDVEAIADHFNELRTTLHMIIDTITEIRRVPYDWRASTRKVRELGVRLNLEPDPTLGPPGAGQTPVKS